MSSFSSWFLYRRRRPVSVEVVLGVCLLWRRSLHVLPVALCRAAAAARGGPTVSPAVGVAQRQISAVPLTVALRSGNQCEAKSQRSTEREEQTRAAGQNKHIHTTQRGHTYDRSMEVMQEHWKLDCQLEVWPINRWFQVQRKKKVQLVADGGESRVSAARKEGPTPSMLRTGLRENKTNYCSVLSRALFLKNHSGSTGTNWYTCTSAPRVMACMVTAWVTRRVFEDGIDLIASTENSLKSTTQVITLTFVI